MPTVYNKGLEEIAKALTDLDGSDLRVLLVKPTYVFDPDHAFVDDGSANDPQSHEVSVVGYARQALANKVITRDDATDKAYLDADDVVFAALAAGQTVGAAILYRHTGIDTTAPLISYYELVDTLTNGGDIAVQWNTPANGGVLKLTSP